MSEHLTEALYSELIEGRLPEKERARVTRHLADECEVCDAFLAGRATIDSLDGIVDEALVSLAPMAPASDELGFRRVEKAMRSDHRSKIGIAVSLLAAGLAAVFLLPPGEREQRFKGEVVEAPMRLELLVSSNGELSPLARGATVQKGDVILFRIQLEQEGCVLLFRDEVRLLEAPVCLGTGEHVLEAEGAPLGWPASSAGRVEFGVVPDGSSAPPDEVARFPIIVEDR